MTRTGLLLFTLALAAWTDERTVAVDKIVAPLRDSNAPGCSIGVMQNGRFVYKTAFGLADLETRSPLTAASAFNVASMSKQFTAAALFFLIDSGKAHLSDPVRRFLPELPVYADAITVADLLHHTSGLRDFGPLLEIAGRSEESLDVAGSLKLLSRQTALNFAPGAGYEYTNSDYLLLGAIVERLTGMPLAAYAEERLFGPLRMGNTQFYGQLQKLHDRASGYVERGARYRKISQTMLMSGAGGLFTTIDDLLQWDDNFYNPEVGGAPFLNFMFTRGRLRSGEPLPYAAGLILGRYAGLNAISHPGSLPGYRSEMIRFPAQHLTVACLCNREDEESPLLARRIAEVYLEDKLRPLRGPADLSYPASAFPELDGVWESPQGWILRAWSSTDGMWIELPDGEFKLYPLNQRQLFTDTGTNRLVLTRFSRDAIALAWDRFPRTVYHRLEGASADPVDPTPYIGDYRSGDADARYRVYLDSGRLWIAGAAAWNVAVNPVGADRFLAGEWTLHFTRDASGRVLGMKLHGPRLWNLWFDKTVDTDKSAPLPSCATHPLFGTTFFMRVLFIGGTGIISTACTDLAISRGIELTLLNRGRRISAIPAGARSVTADIEDPAAVSRALAGESFDAVVDWIAFEPLHIERDLELFRRRTRQFIFISSASAYQKPVGHYLITESTPLANPFWTYSQQKIACEDRLMRAYREESFPITIVRPSLTYGESQITLAINSWARSYTVVDRMRRGRKVIIPGDGSSLWVITHNTDFAKGLVGLLGREQAIGHAFHITSDEVMTWDQWYRITAEAAGVEPQTVHIPSDFLAACIPDSRGGLIGDKAVSVVFDNSKIKRFVPDYCATMPFTQGIRKTIAWFDADPARRLIDEEANTRWDRLIGAWDLGTAEALRLFREATASTA